MKNQYVIKLMDGYRYNQLEYRIITMGELLKLEDYDQNYEEGMLFEENELALAEKFCILLNRLRNVLSKF